MTDSVAVRLRHAAALAGALLVALSSTACSAAQPGSQPDTEPKTQARSGQQDRSDHSRAGRTVARVDVDGDGKADAVYYRSRSEDSASVVVRTDSGERVTRRLSTKMWARGQWHGAARLDGRAGAELVVGTTLGAHTPMFTVLTYRSGALQVMENPAGVYGPEWPIDAFYNGYLGWTRTVRDGTVRLTMRSVLRKGTSREFAGEEQRFQWTANGWQQTGTAPLSLTGVKEAGKVGGWHVDGLPRWADTSGGTAV